MADRPIRIQPPIRLVQLPPYLQERWAVFVGSDVDITDEEREALVALLLHISTQNGEAVA